jgi:hypothetical protein
MPLLIRLLRYPWTANNVVQLLIFHIIIDRLVDSIAGFATWIVNILKFDTIFCATEKEVLNYLCTLLWSIHSVILCVPISNHVSSAIIQMD